MHYSYAQRKQLRKVGVDLGQRETWVASHNENIGSYPHSQGHLFTLTKTYASIHKERKGLQWFYGLRAGTMKTLASSQEGRGGFENRLDVILHRSGLLASIGMARRAIREGHVSVTQVGGIRTCRYPGAPLGPGSLAVVDLEWFLTVTNFTESRYRVPSYRYVDHSLGAVLVERAPRSGEVLFPEVMGVPLRAVRAGYGK